MEYIPQILGVASWFGAAFGLMTFLGKRENAWESDPNGELERSQKIALSIGTFVIWLGLGAAFLAALSSGIFVFIGLATGDNYRMTAEMAAVLAVSLPVYFFLERTLKPLGKK